MTAGHLCSVVHCRSSDVKKVALGSGSGRMAWRCPKHTPPDLIDLAGYNDIEKPHDLCCEPDCMNVAEASGLCTWHVENEEGAP